MREWYRPLIEDSSIWSTAQSCKSWQEVELFESGNFKFGIGICYDIVFPEVARALVKKGARILFFPSN
jgi:predicted amidohydrolase